MTTLYLMRHAESVANQLRILGSQSDFPLSEKGKMDAEAIAEKFSRTYDLTRIISSPLKRAIQTAEPFARLFNLKIETDANLIEQHLGVFTGMHYEEAKNHPGYQHDKTKRWNWVPVGGGESYEMIANRIERFLESLDHREDDNKILVVFHAVAMRLTRALLEDTIPQYPMEMASNGEIWVTEFTRLKEKHEFSILNLN